MKITLLDPETAAAIRADNDRLTAGIQRILDRAGYTSVDSVHWDVRSRSGEIVLTDAIEAGECLEVLRKSTFTHVEVQSFDWSDDPDFDHDREWIISFKVD